MKRGLLAPLLFVCAAAACSGPPSPSSLKDEPFCSDFEMGPQHTKMRGSLKQPLVVKVKDGKRIVATISVNGLSQSAPYASLFLLPDANTDYTVEFHQCPNERAPVEAGTTKENQKGAGLTAYSCGEGEKKPYATAKLVTKKGDPTSRTVSVPEPPVTTCWGAEPAPETPGSASP